MSTIHSAHLVLIRERSTVNAAVVRTVLRAEDGDQHVDLAEWTGNPTQCEVQHMLEHLLRPVIGGGDAHG